MTQPDILWVDDDPFILKSARRLLEKNGYHISTCESPIEALKILETHDFKLVISDQRMPEKTGIEILQELKKNKPQTARMLVTGFLDNLLFEEAINKAGIFRFISKPWDDQSLLNDIKAAYAHHEELLRAEELKKEIREKNKKLFSLTEELERHIFERTKEIQASNSAVENKNKDIVDLAFFSEQIHGMENLEDVIFFVNQVLSSQFPNAVGFLALENSFGRTNVFTSIKKSIRKYDLSINLNAIASEIKLNDFEDKKMLSDHLKIPIRNIITIPLVKSTFKNSYVSVLFIDHDLPKSNVESLLDFLVSRYQILSLVIERILSFNKMESYTKNWEETYNNFSLPLCIIDSDDIILRSNRQFDEKIQYLYKDELEEFRKNRKVILKRNTSIFECSLFNIHIEDETKNSIIYFKDTTQERAIYQNMIQSEKMSALGILAGNIAHELNNPLTGIRSMSQILLKELNDKQNLSDLSEIERAASKCQTIIKELIDFSKTNNLSDSDIIDTAVLIEKTLIFLKTAIRQHNLVLKLEKNLKIKSNYQLLQQVLFNLITNASQSMDSSGIIEVSNFKRKNSVIIQIKDSGTGISNEIKDKIFDPFFTTKKEGVGTGLGLSLSKSIVEKSGGCIYFESKEKLGSTFFIELPAYE